MLCAKTKGMTTTRSPTKQLVIKVDNYVNQLLADGGEEKLLISLLDIMGDIKKIMDSSTKQELDRYAEEHKGFFHVMKLLEALASGIANGSIPV